MRERNAKKVGTRGFEFGWEEKNVMCCVVVDHKGKKSN